MHCFAQNFQLKLIGTNEFENKTLDSLSYSTIHKNSKSINDEIAFASEKLAKLGYLENQFLEKIKKNDSCYVAKFRIGTKTKWVHIYIGTIQSSFCAKSNQSTGIINTKNLEEIEKNTIKNLIAWDSKKDTLQIPFIEIESFLNTSIQKLEEKGFAFAKMQLIHVKIKKDILCATLQFTLDNPRKLNAITVKYDNPDQKNSFPEGHLTQLHRKYRNRTFNKNTVQAIYEDFEKYRFISQIKYPEILFTKDTTKVYVYLKEKKSNTFDGFIGFANTQKNTIRLNGYFDVALENTLNLGEQFSLYWKSDGNGQKTFTSGIEIPYLFKSPIGLKAKIQIFKQDSLFQNTKTEMSLGYYIHHNTRIFLGYQSTQSSNIQNSTTASISDYKNSFVSSNLEYLKMDTQHSLFPIQSKLSLNLGVGKRGLNDIAGTSGSEQQLYLDLQAMYNFYLNPKNCININYHNYILKSHTYFSNELYRFGGINSIRGFTENSFQANLMTSFQTEYRYIVSNDLYLHSILDYCNFKDDSTQTKLDLVGIGLGIGLNTKTGLFKFAFVNGMNKKDTSKLNSTILHINYTIRF